MPRRKTSRRGIIRLASILIFGAVLAACTPDGQAQETQPVITQTIIASETNVPSVTPEISTTPEYSATLENTPTAEQTATPEKSEAKNMHEYCIQRAKEVGIDLENFANSNNLWFTEHPDLENLLESFDNNFSDDQVFKTKIVLGLDSLNSQDRYNRAPTTAANKKIMRWLEAVYKNAEGQYQMVLLPTNIWDIDNQIMWNKSAGFGGPQYLTDVNSKHMFNATISDYSSPDLNPDLNCENSFIGNLAKQNYYIGPGAFISFDSDYPVDETAGGAGTLELPNFSEEQMLDFQKTGETGFFPYFMTDPKTGLKQPFIYPFINYATMIKVESYQDQPFVDEYVGWFTGDNSQWRNPDGPPCPDQWQALP